MVVRMSVRGLRCLLREAGVDQALAQSVIETVYDYLARPDTPPFAVALTRSLRWTEDGGVLRVSVFEMPMY
jgi:hypothetical protein